MEKDWNPNDYQGRSKDQVERKYWVFAKLLILTWYVGTGFFLYALINYIF
jgi:hypothetical protein